MIKQVDIFGKELMSHIIITKLDGTAKGGALFQLQINTKYL